LNSHEINSQQILSLVRLPIPPYSQGVEVAGISLSMPLTVCPSTP